MTTQTQPVRRKRRARAQLSTGGRILIGVFVVLAGVVGYLVFQTVRQITATWSATSIGGLALAPEEGGNTNPFFTFDSSSGPTPEPWDGATRVTILVMGLDYRDWEAGTGPPRTDTMMLFTIDPLTKTAGMLSVPRDLWVDIPGYGHGKINTAYQLGEAAQLPGGGPALAVQTVEQLLGIDIQYYAQVDFNTFVQFIDIIGGIKMNIPATIQVDIIGRPQPVKIRAGVQTLTGEYALAYARARNSEGGDFDRSQRQQAVIFAIRDQILRPEVLGTLLTQAPQLFQTFSTGIRTNMSLDEIVKLGLLATEIDRANIKQGAIAPPNQVLLAKSPDGLDVLIPITQNIRILRDEIFSTSASAGPLAAGGDPAELMRAEAASISVLNGTSTSGLATTAQEYLISLGLNVANVGNSDFTAYTTVIDYTGNPYTVQYLVQMLRIQATRIFSRFDPNSTVDVEVIIGADWSGP